MPHPTMESMLSGGEGAVRHDASLLWLGWGVGTVQILFFGALLALGGRRGGGLQGLGGPLILGTLVCVAVWTAVVLSYRNSLVNPSTELWLGLPAPTALMVYALWPAPLFFVAYYVLGFRRWVLTEEDQKAFAQLVEARRARTEGEAS